MQFSEVIGQTTLKKKLIDQVNSNKISHALLFLGPLGHGGLPLALALSQYVNCENSGAEDSCGICSSCVKAKKMVHPDIHYSYPFPNIDKKERAAEFIKTWRETVLKNPYLNLRQWLLQFNAENKQANIPIKECHDIIKKLSLKSYESEYKTLILWLPEYLGKEGNSLLKILEEPPAKTLFILVAENQDNILNTVVSRTQIINIPGIQAEILQEALQNKFEANAEEAFKLASISNGNYTAAVNLLNNSINDVADLFSEWLTICLPDKSAPRGSKAIALYQWVERFATIGRENQKSFFHYGLHFLKELNLTYFHQQESALLTPQENNLANQMQRHVTLEKIAELYELFNSSHYFLERNANPKILMMNISIKVSSLLKKAAAITANV